MAYLVRIGVSPYTKSGRSSKGWHIWRRGTVVFIRFGPVRRIGGNPKLVRWADNKAARKIRCRTALLAKKERKERLKEKLNGRRKERPYKRLPVGQKILPMERR